MLFDVPRSNYRERKSVPLSWWLEQEMFELHYTVENFQTFKSLYNIDISSRKDGKGYNFE